MIFEKGGGLSFDMELGKSLLLNDLVESKGCPEEPIKKSKKMPTVARADYIGFGRNEKSHRFRWKERFGCRKRIASELRKNGS